MGVFAHSRCPGRVVPITAGFKPVFAFGLLNLIRFLKSLNLLFIRANGLTAGNQRYREAPKANAIERLENATLWFAVLIYWC